MAPPSSLYKSCNHTFFFNTKATEEQKKGEVRINKLFDFFQRKEAAKEAKAQR